MSKKKNIIFLTLVEINSIETRGIYQDLLRKFRNEGHSVTVVTPKERRAKASTKLERKEGVDVLSVKTLNVTKTNIMEKGIGTLLIEYQYLSAIKKYFSNKRFDLVLYSTPPITLVKVIEYIKERDGAYSYLLLKDIFPQNAVDMKMIKSNGFLHRYFTKKEKRLYSISDTIGCMSPANVRFLLKHNTEISLNKVEVNPNSIEPKYIRLDYDARALIREKYDIPSDKIVFVYGGNLGKPQGIDFLLDTVELCENSKAFFLIIGDGTEFKKIQQWISTHKRNNVLLFNRLAKEDYDSLLAVCDVGLIFLHKDFLIPNFPSRLLSYLEMKKPIIAATDPNTDIGDIIEQSKCGFKVISGNISLMLLSIDKMIEGNLIQMGENAWNLLQNEYLVDCSYQTILKKLDDYVPNAP